MHHFNIVDILFKIVVSLTSKIVPWPEIMLRYFGNFQEWAVDKPGQTRKMTLLFLITWQIIINISNNSITDTEPLTCPGDKSR